MCIHAHEVRGVLSGRQTQVRRLVRGDNAKVYWNPIVVNGYGGWVNEHGRPAPCPFGAPGDRLWVRETFSYTRNDAQGFTDSGEVWYWADGNPQDGDWSKPRPSIHMPRWASRITLEIADVRVERLQEISDEDALAEGLRSDGSLGAQCSVELPGHRTHHDSPKECFRLLWESIHGPGSWDVNPFVWVIVFRRIGL